MDETNGAVTTTEVAQKPESQNLKTLEAKLGKNEAAIVARIDKDGPPEDVLKDISGSPGTEADVGGKVIDMVQDTQGNWTARSPEDSKYFYTQTEETKYEPSNTTPAKGDQTDFNGQWQNGEPQRQAQYENINNTLGNAWDRFQQTGRLDSTADIQSNKPEIEAAATESKTGAEDQKTSVPEIRTTNPEELKQTELQKIRMDGAKLASLFYTDEGRQQVDGLKSQVAKIVEATSGKPKRETVSPGFDRSPQAIEDVRKRNEMNQKASEEGKGARIEHLLMGGQMEPAERDAFLTQALGHKPLPTNNYAENQKRETLIRQFDSQRNDLRRAILCKNEESKPVHERYLPTVTERRLKFSGLSRTQAQEAFALGWDDVKSGRAQNVDEGKENPGEDIVGGLALGDEDAQEFLRQESNNPASSETVEKGNPTTSFVTTEAAVPVLKSLETERPDYSLEDAQKEKPLTHYTNGGNLLQIMRFGLQSNNFKNRLSEDREEDAELDALSKEMTGFRVRQGASYQGKDSISMSVWDERMNTGPNGILLLINPNIKVWGIEGQRESTGYGHGISVQQVEGGYEVGNEKAYKSEVAAGNIILPADIRAIVVDKNAGILHDMNQIVHEQAKIYSQEKHRNAARANEDMLASVRLLANLGNDKELQTQADELEKRLSSLSYRDLVMEVTKLQKQGLQKFVGSQELTEDNLRRTLSERFNIKILEKPSK